MSIIYFQRTPLPIGRSQCPLSFDDATLSADPKAALEVLGVNRIALLTQVHGRDILEFTEQELLQSTNSDINYLGKADGVIISNVTNSLNSRLAIGIRSADCLALVIKKSNKIALLHAGWRGLAAGIVENAFARLSLDNNKSAIYEVWVGPSAKECCYEVGPEVLSALALQNQTGSEGLKIDLQDLLVDRINKLSLNTAIELDKTCTVCSLDLHSYRRQQHKLRNLMYIII